MDSISQFETADVSLLDRLQHDDREAFNLLFEKYWTSAYEKALKRINDPVAAKDIVQEIFIHIWEHRHTAISNFAGYLHISIRNRVFQLLRHKKYREHFVDPADSVFDKAEHRDATNLQRKEFYHSFENLVASLPPKRQEIFRMRYTEEMNTKQIAVKLGLTQKTVQNQLGKAVDKLRLALVQLFMLMTFILVY